MTSTETLSWNCHLLKGSPVYHFFWDSTHAITSWCMIAKVVAPCLDSEHLWRTVSAPEIVLRSAEALIASALAFTLCFCSILLPSLPQFLFSRILLNKLVLVYLKSIPQNLNQRQYLKSHPLSPPSHIFCGCFMQTQTHLKWVRSHLNHVLYIFSFFDLGSSLAPW